MPNTKEHAREIFTQESQNTVLPETSIAEESIPAAIVPYNRDDDRSRYLGLRASGFTIREALNLIGKAKSSLSNWRHDPQFCALEERIPELKKTLALEYAGLEFLRNYRLILEKDYRVIRQSLHRPTVPATEEQHTLDGSGNIRTIPAQSARTLPMDNQDFQYLLKMRAHYTPQQLQGIEQLFSQDMDKEFNWTDFVLTLSRTKEEVKIEHTNIEMRVETRHRQPAELSNINDEDERDTESTGG